MAGNTKFSGFFVEERRLSGPQQSSELLKRYLRLLLRTMYRVFCAQMLRACLLGLSALFVVSLLSVVAEARLTGMSGNGCSGCHASNEGPPDIRLEMPVSFEPGERVAMTVHISAADIRGGGFYIQAEAGEGAFEAGSGSKLSGRGLTHTIRKAASGGEVSFDFHWTAPNEPQATRFLVSAVAANANNARSGDRAGDIEVDVAYGCTGVILYRDWDQDGYGRATWTQLKCGLPEGFAMTGDDCNDNNKEVHPGASELCNQRDDNCNDEVDEGTDQFTFYLDEDGDGHGVPGQEQTFSGCALRDGLAPNDDDCDDGNPLTYPSAIELCNGVDDNCNGQADEGLLLTCGVGECQRTTESCFDRDCIPGLPSRETCNGKDDDCDGFVDEELGLCPVGQVCGMSECIPDPNLDPSVNMGGAPGEQSDAGADESAEAPDAAVSPPATEPEPTQPPAQAPETTQMDDAGAAEASHAGGQAGVATNTGSGGGSSGGCAFQPNRGAAHRDYWLWGVLLASVVWGRQRRHAARALTSVALLGSSVSGFVACSDETNGGQMGERCPGANSCPAENIEDDAATDDSAADDEDDSSDDGADQDAGNGAPPDDDGPVLSSMDAGLDAGPLACVDECNPAAVSSCSQAMVRSCWKILDDCSFWNESACRLGYCADEVSCAVCNHTCETDGASGCRNGTLGSCVADADNCRHWEVASECASGFCADESECGSCQHECDAEAPAECADAMIRRCVTDEFGCRRWSLPSPCILGCRTTQACESGWSIGQRGGGADDEFIALAVGADDSVAAVGAYYDFSNFDAIANTTDAYLSVKDREDRIVLSERWGSDANDEAVGVASIRPDQWYVAGWAEGPLEGTRHRGGRDGFVTLWQTSAQQRPEIVWTRMWGSDQHDIPRALGLSRDGDALVFGGTVGQLDGNSAAGGEDLMLARFDAVGNRLFVKQWGTAAADVGTDVSVAADGSAFVIGRTSGALGDELNAGASDAFLQKLSVDGTVEFTRLWGGASGDAAEAMVMATGGDLIIVGTTQGVLPGETAMGGIDLFVSRWTQAGELLWQRQWGTTTDDRVYDVALDGEGRIYAAASVRNGEGDCPLGQAWLVVWEPDGTPLHNQLWDTCEADEFRAVAVDSNHRVALVGSTRGAFLNESSGGTDAIIVTYHPPF